MEDDRLLREVVLSLGAAWRAVRLYPLESQMTQQATGRACAAIEEYVQAEPSLKLDVMRGGLMLRGLDDILSPPGVPELAEALGSHGIGEIHFVAPPETHDMLSFFEAARMKPQELEEAGGMQKALVHASVTTIRVVPLILTKVEAPPEIPEEEADKFLAELAADAGRLAVWLRSLLASDDEGLAEGIRVLADAAGDVAAFGRTMAAAFLQLETNETDRLLEVSMHLPDVRDVCTEMLANLSATETTAAVRGGRYGTNVMAMSYALASLPVGGRVGELVSETAAALRAADASEAEVALLERMVRTRQGAAPETSLADARPDLQQVARAVADAATQSPATLAHARTARYLDAAGVSLLLELLNVAPDVEAYSAVLETLGRAVPRLMETGDPDLAMSIVRNIGRLSESVQKPWPGLDARLAAAAQAATGPETMAHVLLLHDREQAVGYARELVAAGGDAAAQTLAAAALASEAEGSMDFAAEVLGKRLPELLAPAAGQADARHAMRLAELFARDGSPTCVQALAELVTRTEDQVRSKAARGIAAVGGPVAAAYLTRLLRDSSSTVAIVSARALAENPSDAAVNMLAARLIELEGEGDVPLAREIVGALAGSASPAAAQALQQASEKGKLIGKGRHPAIRQLAADALGAQQKAGGA